MIGWELSCTCSCFTPAGVSTSERAELQQHCSERRERPSSRASSWNNLNKRREKQKPWRNKRIFPFFCHFSPPVWFSGPFPLWTVSCFCFCLQFTLRTRPKHVVGEGCCHRMEFVLCNLLCLGGKNNYWDVVGSFSGCFVHNVWYVMMNPNLAQMAPRIHHQSISSWYLWVSSWRDPSVTGQDEWESACGALLLSFSLKLQWNTSPRTAFSVADCCGVTQHAA